MNNRPESWSQSPESLRPLRDYLVWQNVVTWVLGCTMRGTIEVSFETLDDWRAYAPGDLVEVIKGGVAPGTWDECRSSEWENVLVFFCEATFTIENLRFLWAVSENLIYGNQPLNLYPESSAPIDDWYRDENRTVKIDLFDRAEREVVESFSGTYSYFRGVVNKVRRQLGAEGERTNKSRRSVIDSNIDNTG
jgi:hypothetical protein